jgi:hypothetical protein
MALDSSHSCQKSRCLVLCIARPRNTHLRVGSPAARCLWRLRWHWGVIHALGCVWRTCRPIYFLLGVSPRAGAGRGFAQRACAARRSASLRSFGLTLRHRAAPSPSAVRRIGEGESFLLAMSSSSIATSSKISGGSPVSRITRRRRAVRRLPSSRANSVVSGIPGVGRFLLAMRVLVWLQVN